MPQLQCIVVTPETTVLEEPADFVVLPLFDGEIGIAPKHAPLIGRLGYGELRLKQAGKITRYYIDGGFVQVVGDVVSVLTNRAIPAEQLDPQVAEEHLSAARARKATGDEALAQRDRQEEQARRRFASRVTRNSAGRPCSSSSREPLAITLSASWLRCSHWRLDSAPDYLRHVGLPHRTGNDFLFGG